MPTKTFYIDHPTVGETRFTIATSAGSTTNVSLELWDNVVSFDAAFEFKMNLQRKVSGSWTTIGSKSGSFTTASPAHRSFTNVAAKNAEMRVQVYLYGYGSNYTSHKGTFYSTIWTY